MIVIVLLSLVNCLLVFYLVRTLRVTREYLLVLFEKQEAIIDKLGDQLEIQDTNHREGWDDEGEDWEDTFGPDLVPDSVYEPDPRPEVGV